MAKLTILGSGTSLSSFYKPLDFRHEAAHLLQTSNANILLDCGEGVRQRLDKIGFDYYKLDAIFITHFHPDHFDLDPLIQSFSVRARKEKRNKLSIYGPKNIENIFAESWNHKHKPDHYPKEFNLDLQLNFFEFKEDETIHLKDIELAPFKVAHIYMDAYAFRIKSENKIIVYSGDSGECDGLARASDHSDLFLCESATNIGEEVVEGHLSPFQAGQIAKKSQVKKIVLTHYTGKDSEESMLEEVKKSGFEGEVKIAQDFQEFQI